MKFAKLDRAVIDGEVRSSYAVDNLTVHLTSRFSEEGKLEDALYELALQRLRSQVKSEGRQHDDGHTDGEAV